METTGQHRLYSITQAAREMHLGKDSVYFLISQGKIGTIRIGKREKIPVSEIEKYQTENTIRRTQGAQQNNTPIPQATISRSKSLFRKLKQEILNGKRL